MRRRHEEAVSPLIRILGLCTQCNGSVLPLSNRRFIVDRAAARQQGQARHRAVPVRSGGALAPASPRLLLLLLLIRTICQVIRAGISNPIWISNRSEPGAGSALQEFPCRIELGLMSRAPFQTCDFPQSGGVAQVVRA